VFFILTFSSHNIIYNVYSLFFCVYICSSSHRKIYRVYLLYNVFFLVHLLVELQICFLNLCNDKYKMKDSRGPCMWEVIRRIVSNGSRLFWWSWITIAFLQMRYRAVAWTRPRGTGTGLPFLYWFRSGTMQGVLLTQRLLSYVWICDTLRQQQ